MPYKWKEDKKAYQKEYHAKWYKKNKDKVIEQKRRLRQERIEWYKSLKRTLSCKQCGNSHPAVLDFHHRDPDKKEITLCSAARRDWSQKRILAEMEKCDILCSNCHRIFHWNNRNKDEQ